MGTNITINRRVKIKVNGVEYDSVDQLPPDVREAYQKALAKATVSTMSVTVNGQTVDDVPAEFKAVVGAALGKPTRTVPLWAVLALLGVVAVVVLVLLRLR